MKKILRPVLMILVVLAITAYGWIDGQPAHGQVIWPDISLVQLATGLDEPTHITHAGDGSGRLFIVEQAGKIKMYQDELLTIPFLDITDRVRSPSNGGGHEEGLLSVAFPPNFGEDGNHFYVYYTRLDGDNQVSRFTLSQDSSQADPGSEESILLLEHPKNRNHNGGQLAFGQDGYLYIGTGDGGGAYDPDDSAQYLNSLLGKILRIDVEYEPANEITGAFKTHLPLIFRGSHHASTLRYKIPPDNPFIQNPDARDEIWALGLRNPWRFSFDRATGDLYIGDVGQGDREEIDYQPSGSRSGENYGWDIYEGDICLKPPCDSMGMVFPIYFYSHETITAASVTGGNVYRGTDYPTLEGIYFFSDFYSSKLSGLKYESGGWQSHEFNTGDRFITSFGEDENGELYFVSHNGGALYQITASQ